MEFSHWYKYFDSTEASPLDLYKSIEEELRVRKLPSINLGRVSFFEGTIFSARRLYLQITRDKLRYHVCAAPFGTGFFVSSRLVLPFPMWPFYAAGGIACFIFFIFVVAVAWKGIIAGFLAAFFWSVFLLFLFAVSLVIWYFVDHRITYYRIDTALMFQEATHGVLLGAVDGLVSSKGLKPLTELERKPVLHKLLTR